MSHIVESCPLTKLNGGLSRLHSADEDAVSWLTNYGKWHAYKKKKIGKVTTSLKNWRFCWFFGQEMGVFTFLVSCQQCWHRHYCKEIIVTRYEKQLQQHFTESQNYVDMLVSWGGRFSTGNAGVVCVCGRCGSLWTEWSPRCFLDACRSHAAHVGFLWCLWKCSEDQVPWWDDKLMFITLHSPHLINLLDYTRLCRVQLCRDTRMRAHVTRARTTINSRMLTVAAFWPQCALLCKH